MLHGATLYLGRLRNGLIFDVSNMCNYAVQLKTHKADIPVAGREMRL